jgi:hypothetical protein
LVEPSPLAERTTALEAQPVRSFLDFWSRVEDGFAHHIYIHSLSFSYLSFYFFGSFLLLFRIFSSSFSYHSFFFFVCLVYRRGNNRKFNSGGTHDYGATAGTILSFWSRVDG